MSKPQTWRNRIVGHGEEAPDQLLANPGNWRIHPKAQQDALAGVLDEVGWVQDIIVNRQTGHVVDGHLRVSLAISRRESTVPVVYVDLDPAEEALVLATIDPLSAMAAADKEQLDSLLREVQTSDEAVNGLLNDLRMEVARQELKEERQKRDMYGTLAVVDGYDWEIDPAKLGYRLEAVAHCAKRGRALELYAGKGILSYWYRRLFDELVRVDTSSEGQPDVVAKAEA